MMSDADDEFKTAMLDLIETIAAVMGTTDPDSERLKTWLQEHIAGMPLEADPLHLLISTLHGKAHSFAPGVEEAIRGAPYIAAGLQRTGPFGFSLMVPSTGEHVQYSNLDDITDQLLNNFSLGYIRPPSPGKCARPLHTALPALRPCFGPALTHSRGCSC